jgi:class 3 adenylate cyclase/tetratricopeptide (TPR) repeat protein
MLPRLVSSYSILMDIEAWLKGLGLGQYARRFAENDVDAEVLAQLTDADLKELGVTSLGHRKRLLAALAATPRTTVAPAPGVPADTAAGERREVTILFADLSGFTALAQTLDPEELHELVACYTKLVDSIVATFGGTIDKHIGDAVMALFGAPIAHDDDPVRAARAALDIHEGLARLSDNVGRTLRAHIGIASGEVVAGALGRGTTQDYTVLGDSVNLAARLVAAAGPGETLISASVRNALAGRAVSEARGEMALKGIVGSVAVWQLRGLASEPAAARSSFVGREAELEQFRSMLGACLARRSGQVVYVRGEAGIGKTRLVGEMRQAGEAAGFAVHRALILDFGVAKDQDAVRSLVRSLLDLPTTADAAERLAAAERVAASGIVASDHLAFLHDLLDLPPAGEWAALYAAMDNAARNRGKRAVMANLVAASCRRRPTIIVVEDLHWANPRVLDHLAAIAAALSEGPGLMAMTSRIEGDRIDAAWRAACRETPFATIDLGPLRHDEALRLAGGFVDATQRMVLACVDRAGGNPLFLEQLLRNAEEGSGESIPASIRSLVLARMDRLEPLDRKAFQAAAVIGQRFELPLLRQLVGIADYDCAGLLQNALVLPESEGFLFAHALIQEGAYASLLKARRRLLHRVAAEWFAERDPVLHAQHLDRAEDERAAAAYRDAAVAQRAAYHTEVALGLAERGLVLAERPEERHALAGLKGELQRDLGDIAGSIATYRAALSAAPDDVARCQAQLGLAEGLRVSEGLDEALALLDAAQQAAERHDLVLELARLHHLRGNIFFPLGKIEGCSIEHERGLGYARRLGSAEAEARALGGVADAAFAQGRMRRAFMHFSRCVELAHRHGFGRIEVANRSMIGFSRLYLCEAREAREDGAAAARAAALVVQPRAEMLAEACGVFASYELGDYTRMTSHLEREMLLIRQLGARRFEAVNLEMQGRRLLDLGAPEAAADCLRAALEICRDVGMGFCGPKVLSALARAVEDDGERDHLLGEGEGLLRRGSIGQNHLWFHRDSIEARLAAGDTAGALRYAEQLENYTRSEPLPWSDLVIARARALVRLRHNHRDEAARRDLAKIRDALVASGFVAFIAPIEAALAA